ncbi:hypothetical protein FPQ10_06415 [Allobacillus sp. SKP2-8]|uniref:hypothetical protein n=1 Tax=unclassified Allobacillus TaxID=2628859 RepID=UPI001183A18E|nr:hypothetical protein [Allobacillus sp. SKP2-8]TSJ66889.1 hypothetical protein FPQ10_06415 [Allobacillus sp. SKP2-8]
MAINYRKCPACDSTNVIPIVYGEPDSYLALEADETKVLLGGCVIMPNSPEYHCRNCEKEWTREESITHAYEQIERLEMKIGSFSEGHTNMMIDFVKQTVVLSRSYIEEDSVQRTLTNDEIKSIRFRLRLVDILNWRRQYTDSRILDGQQWKITLYRSRNRRSIKRAGDNRYPEQWEDFCELMSDITGKEFNYSSNGGGKYD